MRLGQQIKGEPAHGVEHGAYRQAVIRVDHETFDEMRAKAARDDTSLAEAIRTLIEWGLEAEREKS